MSAAGEPPGADAAWVVFETPFGVDELAAFCRDLERLYRINPHLEIESWQQSAPDRFRAEVLNHSNGRRARTEASVVRVSNHAFRVEYAEGLKKNTRFEIEPAAGGSRLTITEEYRPTGGSAPQDEIDRSLRAWGVALKAHLERDRRWGWLPLYRPLVNRLWLPMKPAARRITFLILVIAVADIALIALVLAIYWLEAGRVA